MRANIRTDIDEELQRFFMPQARQFGLVGAPMRFGELFRIPPEVGAGFLWAAQVEESCLVTVHDITTSEDILMTECPPDYCCLASLSRPVVERMPNRMATSHAIAERNIVSFAQREGSYTCRLDKGLEFSSVCIVMLPEFFCSRGKDARAMELLRREISKPRANCFPLAIERVLAGINLERLRRPGSDLFLRSVVNSALYAIVDHATERSYAAEAASSPSSQRLVAETKKIVETHLAEGLTLEAIARTLFTSRTRLCEVFKRETGQSLGSYIAERRIERACGLLSSPSARALAGCAEDPTMTQLAALVGFKHASSFISAFKRHVGMPPTQWREDHAPHAAATHRP